MTRSAQPRERTAASGRERRHRPEVPSTAAGRESALLFALAIVTFLLIGAVSVRQATGPARATGVLQDAVAATTEIDLLLARELPGLKESARSGRADLYPLPGYPIEVYLTRDEVMSLDEGAVRALLLRRSAHAVYADGLKAFDRTGHQEIRFLSLQGQMDVMIDNLTSTRHSQAGRALLLLAPLFAVLAVAVLLVGEGHSGFRKLGMAIEAGAGFGLIVSAITWFVAGLVGGSDAFVTDLRDIARTLVATPIRNYAIVLIAGVLVAGLTPAFALASRFAGSEEPPSPGGTGDDSDWEYDSVWD